MGSEQRVETSNSTHIQSRLAWLMAAFAFASPERIGKNVSLNGSP